MTTSNPLADEFHSIFEKHLRKQVTHSKAYEDAEAEFQGKYNHNKYSGFESFRISRRYRIRKKKT